VVLLRLQELGQFLKTKNSLPTRRGIAHVTLTIQGRKQTCGKYSAELRTNLVGRAGGRELGSEFFPLFATQDLQDCTDRQVSRSFIIGVFLFFVL
jgi:hypothetical protein